MKHVPPCCRLATMAAAALIATIAAGREAPAVSGEMPPHPDRGLYTLGFDSGGRIAALPFIKGGRILLQWGDLEVGEGRYDFSPLDRQLAHYHELGRKAAVQVNGVRKPRWLFDRVAVLPGKRIQVGDPEGALQFWDPIFIAAYIRFIHAYGDHLRHSPFRHVVLGVRQNFNAVGTERGGFKDDPAALDPGNWQPAPDGRIIRTPWSPEIYRDYRRQIVAAHIAAFHPDIPLFLRNNVFTDDVLEPGQIRLLEQGGLGLFHTSSEHQPRGDTPKYEAFLQYCRSGFALGYTEPYTVIALGATGGARQQSSRSKVSPSQYNYWRLLLDLHCGISCIALKPDDLRHFDEPEFASALEFASRYVGWHAHPGQSPGAWVALREGDSLPGDYTFMMRRVAAESTDVALYDQGPADQRFGGWARAVEPGGCLVFEPDPKFVQSLTGAVLRIVYLDQGDGRFTITWRHRGEELDQVVRKPGIGRWQEAHLEIPPSRSAGNGGTARIVLTGTDRNIFHLVEIQRKAVGGQPGSHP